MRRTAQKRRSWKFIALRNRIQAEQGMPFRDYLFRRVNIDGLNATALAADLGISRKLVYTYARLVDVDLQSRTVAIDLRQTGDRTSLN